jgi:hypothetical protein
MANLVNDMNQLHGLLIQANDDNRMMFDNVRTVARVNNSIYDIIKLMAEMNKVAEIGPSPTTYHQSLNPFTHELSITESNSQHNKSLLPSIGKSIKLVRKSIK